MKKMRNLLNHIPKRKGSRPGWISSSASAFLTLVVLVSSVLALVYFAKGTSARASTSFSFTAGGDYGQTNSTTANLQYIAASEADFNLALGDLNYDSETVTAQA